MHYNVANMSFNSIQENKILMKISEFTVIEPVHEILVLITLSSNGGSGEYVQTQQNHHRSHTQSMNVDEDLDKNLDR